MPRQCTICGKKSILGRQYKKLMSRYNPTPKKRKRPNLQWAHVPVEIKRQAYKEFIGKRVLMCTKCKKAMAKEK